MDVREAVPLSSLTTLKVGGPASIVVTCESVADIQAALALSRERGLPFYVLGSGSNVLAPDEGYKGVIILIRTEGVTFTEEGSGVVVTAAAGVSWDALVTIVAERGLWGVENLAGIPGTVGAAPIQNIGAYGAELAGTLQYVDVLDAVTGEAKRLSKEECTLGYRDSRFKHEPTLVVTSVTLLLSKEGTPKIEYKDLLALQAKGVDLSTPVAIGTAVREVRKGKFPDLATTGTAGSFFKNPILMPEQYEALKGRFGDIPSFPNPNGVKIPLAFVLDRVLSLRGYRMGPAWLFGSQPLVLALEPGGTASDVESLAQHVEANVQDAIGVSIEREVRSMPKQ